MHQDEVSQEKGYIEKAQEMPAHLVDPERKIFLLEESQDEQHHQDQGHPRKKVFVIFGGKGNREEEAQKEAYYFLAGGYPRKGEGIIFMQTQEDQKKGPYLNSYLFHRGNRAYWK